MAHPLPKNRIWLQHNISEPAFGADGKHIFYIRTGDGRPNLVRQDLQTGLTEIIVAEPSPRGNVGYGGGAYAIRGNLLVFAAGGQLWRLDLATGAQRTLTPKYEGLAAPALSACGRYAACVIELDGHAEIIVTDTAGEQLPIKVSSAPAFAANPTFAPDGKRLAWMEWAADKMPWDECALRIARFAQPTTEGAVTAALLPLVTDTLATPNVSYANPQWNSDADHFAYTSDQSGWRSLVIADADGRNGEQVDTGRGEIGLPDWIQGQAAIRWGAGGRCYVVRRDRGTARLLCISPDRSVTELQSTWTKFTDIAVHGGATDTLLYIAATDTHPTALVSRLDNAEVVRAGTTVGLIDSAGLARSEIVEWPAPDGTPVYGLLYRARRGTGPRPLLVWIHGGPTSEVQQGWDAQAQYFASRGWHYLAVNYRGGTGSGRAYQDLLNEQWGVVDVEDARGGAEHLIAAGAADPRRVTIGGGSAGGYTTLMSLVRHPDFWAAGVSLYGIGNLYDLQLGAHRFEARYNEILVGPLPETADRWIERSALTHVKRTKAPVLLFHGKEDTAVPYQQSVEFAEAVQAQGGIAELVLYDDEGHGFRKERNRKDVIERMERFLEKYVINLQGRRS